MLARRVLDLDFDEIEAWFDKWDMRIPDLSLFPKTGFIINGIAAGFLYFTDSSVGIIDCFISNPFSDPKDRDSALNEITGCLVEFARSHGCKLIKCDTKLEVIKTRATLHGFKSNGAYESFYLEI